MKPKPSELRFKTLCDFFEACARRKSTKKKELLRDFADKFIERGSPDVYEIYRLMAPSLDKERDHYNLREANLVRVLVKACLLDPKTSSAVKKAENWRQAGVKNAGQFSNVMEEYLFRTCCGKQRGMPGEADLTVGEINDILNKIASASGSDEQVKLFSHLIQATTARQMRWIVQIVLRDLKIGLSETSILREYHVDAVERYNVTCDFPGVIRELTDPHKRFPFQDIKVGKPAKPQLARAVKGPEEAYNIMKGRPFVVETKFDGERMQVHVMKDEVQYYSRRGIEHGTYSHYTMLDTFIRKQLRETDVILDGEVVVWNKLKKKFEPFGGMKPAVLAAKDNKGPDELLEMNGWNGDVLTSDPDYQTPFVKDLELVFVVFDILYVHEQSVINRTLLERHALLKELVIPAPAEGHPVSCAMSGRMVCLLPGVPLMFGVPGSKLSHNLEDIQEKFEESVRVNEEGIVVKAADSKWKCNDRGLSWLKIKPDYVHKVEIDAVIIGAKFGTGRRGGGISEYLLALAEVPQGGATEPSTFVSFCLVGTGVNDAERKTLADRLNPLFVDNVKGRNCVPRCYRTTGMPKERPDVWIKDPTRSIVLQVQADVRTIVSKQFASRHSLRFPRVQRVRWDKSPLDIQTDQELWDTVESNQGAIVGGGERDAESPTGKGRGKKRAPRKEPQAPAQQRSKVVEQFLPTNVSHIRRECDALSSTLVYFVPAPAKTARYQKSYLEELVARMGGKVTQNYIPRVTHVIAQDAYDPFFKARKDRVDMISVEWLLECSRTQALVPLRPHHYMHLTKETRMNVPNVCKYGDMYYEDVSATDVEAILNNHAHLEPGALDDLAALLAEEGEDPHSGEAGPQNVTAAALKERLKRTPGVEEIMLAVDRELAEHGLLDASACLFRGCHICILQLPGTCSDQEQSEAQQPPLLSCAAAMRESSSAAQRDLAKLQAQRMKLEVMLHGGKVSDAIDMSTTHMVVLTPPDCPQPTLSMADLLSLLHCKKGGTAGLTTLRELIAAGQVHLVKQSWVEQSLAALQEGAEGEVVRRASELRHGARVAFDGARGDSADANSELPSVEQWPWEAFGVKTAPSPSARAKKRGRSTSPSETVATARKRGGTSRSRGRKAPKPLPLAPGIGGRAGRGGRGRGRRRKRMVNETSSSENEASSMEASASGCDDVARPTVLEDSDEDGTQQNPPERLNREPAINAAAPSAAQNKGGLGGGTSMLDDLLSLPMTSSLAGQAAARANSPPEAHQIASHRQAAALPEPVSLGSSREGRASTGAGAEPAVIAADLPQGPASATGGPRLSLRERMALLKQKNGNGK